MALWKLRVLGDHAFRLFPVVSQISFIQVYCSIVPVINRIVRWFLLLQRIYTGRREEKEIVGWQILLTPCGSRGRTRVVKRRLSIDIYLLVMTPLYFYSISFLNPLQFTVKHFGFDGRCEFWVTTHCFYFQSCNKFRSWKLMVLLYLKSIKSLISPPSKYLNGQKR